MNPTTARIAALLTAGGLLLSSCSGGDPTPAPATSSPATAAPAATLAVPADDPAGEYFAQVLETQQVSQAFSEITLDTWQDEAAAAKLARQAKTEFAVLPIPVAVRAFHEGAPIKLAAATFWDKLEVFGTTAPQPGADPQERAWAENLGGASIITALPAHSVPALALRHVLDRAGLEDTPLEFADSPEQALDAVRTGRVAGVLDYAKPGAGAAAGAAGLYPQFVLQDEWARTTGLLPRLFSLGLVANEEFLAEHREEVRVLVRAAIDHAGKEHTPVLPARDIASELERFPDALGPEGEQALGAPSIDADFFAQRRA